MLSFLRKINQLIHLRHRPSGHNIFKLALVIPILALQHSYAQQYCNYIVKENESLNSILESYLKRKKRPRKEIIHIIYKSDGILTDVRNINQLESVNRLSIGELIKIPCDWLPNFVASDTKTPLNRFSISPYFATSYQFFKSEDKINSSDGNVFVFPKLSIGVNLVHSLTYKWSVIYIGEFTYSFIDDPDNGRNLDRTSTSVEKLVIGGRYKLNSSFFTLFLTYQRSIFLKSINSDQVNIERFRFINIGLKYLYNLSSRFGLASQIGLSMSGPISSDEFKNGVNAIFSAEYKLAHRLQTTIAPYMAIEKMNSIFEEQTGIKMGFQISKQL